MAPVNIQLIPFVVRVALDDEVLAAKLPAGTTGEAAIYTDIVRPTHIIRRVMIRMTSFLNYILPF